MRKEEEFCQRCEQQKDSEKYLIEKCFSVERTRVENDITDMCMPLLDQGQGRKN